MTRGSSGNNSDRVRTMAAVALALAQPVSTRTARWIGRGTPEIDQAAATQGPVTPTGGAFVIWAPLFAGNIAYAIADLKDVRRGGPGAGAAGWWVNAAFAANVAWSLNAQFRRLDRASVALIAAAAACSTTAVARTGPEPRGGAAGAAVRRWVAPLAGWLSVATFANLEAALNLRNGRPSEPSEVRRATALVAAAATSAAATAVGLRGNIPFALAVTWGLGGIVLKAVRAGHRPVAAAAAIGALGTAAAATPRAQGLPG